VTIRPEEGFAGLPESLHVDGVTDAITGSAVPQAKSPAGALQKNVIVRILEIGLDQIMVYILNRNIGFNAVETHGIQFEHH
jgi:hypothetical protein